LTRVILLFVCLSCNIFNSNDVIFIKKSLQTAANNHEAYCILQHLDALDTGKPTALPEELTPHAAFRPLTKRSN
jgi:hypothetical protein